MKQRRTRGLCVEIYKTPNNLNPDFMKDLFRLRVTNTVQKGKYKLNLEIP